MSETSKKKGFIVSSFKDEGTGESFTAGTTPLIDIGAYMNYEAAGLVRVPDPPRPASKAAPAKAKARTKPAARPVASKTTPAPAPAPVVEVAPAAE